VTSGDWCELRPLVAQHWSSIEAALVGLRAIDAWGRRHKDLRGVFASAYAIVLAAVANAKRRGVFGDPTWVDEVVVDFADRYRVAVLAAARGQPTRCWGPALARSQGNGSVAIVALLHGMIAHIHYDLPHSLRTCAPLDARRVADYDRLGAVICGATPEIQRVIVDAYAPELRGLHGVLRGADTWITNVVVRAWRSRARSIAVDASASPIRAIAWRWRLGLECAGLATALEVFAWPLGR
jgi:hypothetical protein